ncbi:MAG: hypothetical protein HKN20_11820 [Gemmatimonadetes bacterium]|nr:hypothetical protein [Gemmatimonadota bacterium]
MTIEPHHVRNILITVFALLPGVVFAMPAAPAFTDIEFVPNIETIGVTVRGTSLPGKAYMLSRKTGTSIQWPAHPLVHIDNGSLAGSLFDLEPDTEYEVTVIDGATWISGLVRTQPDTFSYQPSSVIHVDDDAAAGGDGSFGAPFRTIQEGVNQAGPGTRVLVADGVYRESVTFPNSGTTNDWIQVIAEGTGAVLDGADHLAGSIWTPHATQSNVWFTTIPQHTMYVAKNGARSYRYDDLSGLLAGLGHNGVSMAEGWWADPSGPTLYVRSTSNPAGSTWQVAQEDHAFKVFQQDWVWIEGFEIRYYGRSGDAAVYFDHASHVVFRNNVVHHMPRGVQVYWESGSDRGNDSRIEYNEIYDDPVHEWPWSAVKGTSMEGIGIQIAGHKGAIVRGNNVHELFNGIYVGRWGTLNLEDPDIAFDGDIYDNDITEIGDDGLEPEGACINQRFRNNRFSHGLVGISLAPITHGPTWVMRSTFTEFIDSSIKWGVSQYSPDGIVYIYHNTIWAEDVNENAMSIYNRSDNWVLRNNIFRGTYHTFEAFAAYGNTGHDWGSDNWYTTWSGPAFRWEGVIYDTMDDLCAATGLECDGFEHEPDLVDPDAGDFTLNPTSPNVDAAQLIAGINWKFHGDGPDLGAYELAPPVTVDVAEATEPVASSSFFGRTVGPGNALFDFRLPEASLVTLTLYDVAGRRVRQLLDRELPAGRHQVEFGRRSGDDRIASGVYFGRLETQARGKQTDARTARVLLVR